MKICNVLLGLCFASLAACATVPAQEMADARAELKAAEEMGVKDSAADLWMIVRRDMSTAEQQLELGNYSQARAYAKKVREGAARARKIVQTLEIAHQAIERARKEKVLWTVAEGAYKAALAASRNGDAGHVASESALAEQFVMLAENQAALELARLTIESCPEQNRTANADAMTKAAEAIAANKGDIAVDLARKACR